MSNRADPLALTPELLLRAYSIGLFPMAESADDPSLFWVDPPLRGVFPLDRMIVHGGLAKRVRSDRFTIAVDRDFEGVLDGCAAAGPGRPNTWINGTIRRLYRALFDAGHVHTVETLRDGVLVGGLYGVAIGGAFFGESMFHRETDASKAALLHLAARLLQGGFTLLDTQFVTPHLASLGAIEISRADYHALLGNAIATPADFWTWPRGETISGRKALARLSPPLQE